MLRSRSILRRIASGILFVALPLLCRAPLAGQVTGGADQPSPLDRRARAAVVDSLRALLVRVYVDADTGRLIAEHLRRRAAAGAYDRLTDRGEFGRALTRDLRSVNRDEHLGVGYEPGAPLDRLGPRGLEFAGEGGGDDSAAVEAQARGFHYGLGKLEILAGNIGYAELTGFFEGAGAERMMLAALEYVKDTDAVILDLRRHGGGSGDMSNWLLSHFLGPDSLLTLRVAERVNARTVDRYTLARVPGPRRAEVPLYVLTSRGTASAAEDFTFVLRNLDRVIVIGDRTAGAGHNNTLLGLGEGFIASISFSRVTDPASGREWERTGIAPDIAVPAHEALAAAHLAALDSLGAALPPPAARRLSLLRETAAAGYAPRTVPDSLLMRYAGSYGDRHVTIRSGALWYRRGELQETPLIALTDSTFATERTPAMRFEFRIRGESVRLLLRQPDGRVEEVARDR